MLFQFLQAIFGKFLFFTSAVWGKGTYERPLSAAEEKKYLPLAQAGDAEALDILVRHNMRLVAHIAKKYNGAADSDDILSVGTIGLIKAIRSFQSGKGTQFATYTARCIENEMLMLIRSGKKYKANASLSDPIGSDKDGNEITLGDVLESGDESLPESVERNILCERIHEIMQSELSERERQVVDLRFGLTGVEPLPQREVAKRLRISRSYVSRIEKKAVGKIKEELIANGFDEE